MLPTGLSPGQKERATKEELSRKDGQTGAVAFSRGEQLTSAIWEREKARSIKILT